MEKTLPTTKRQRQNELLIMQNRDRAATDEFADDGVGLRH